MAVQLSDEAAEELASEIMSLMHRWSSSDQYADYECAWCCRRPPTNQGEISHEKNCAGEKFLKLLRPAPIE